MWKFVIRLKTRLVWPLNSFLIGLVILTCLSLLLLGTPLSVNAQSAAGLSQKGRTPKKPTIDDIYFGTENYPPYNFERYGKLQGIAVDLLMLIFNELGYQSKRIQHQRLPHCA